MQANTLQVDDLITNKSVTILKASRILNTHCVKIPVLANVEIFLKHHDMVPYSTNRPNRSTCCIPFRGQLVAKH
jgi:hypothetical protein